MSVPLAVVSAVKPVLLSVEDVADRLDIVFEADGEASELAEVLGRTRVRVSEVTVRQIETLLSRLRLAVPVRCELGELEPTLLRAGVERWSTRRALSAAAALAPHGAGER
jgi:hypothetical protein